MQTLPSESPPHPHHGSDGVVFRGLVHDIFVDLVGKHQQARVGADDLGNGLELLPDENDTKQSNTDVVRMWSEAEA